MFEILISLFIFYAWILILLNGEDKLQRQQLLTGVIYQLIHCRQPFNVAAQATLVKRRFTNRADQELFLL